MSRIALEAHRNRYWATATKLARGPTLASRALENRNTLRKNQRAGARGPQARVAKGRT